eukprot:5689056-Amphidinium_carterae.1
MGRVDLPSVCEKALLFLCCGGFVVDMLRLFPQSRFANPVQYVSDVTTNNNALSIQLCGPKRFCLQRLFITGRFTQHKCVQTLYTSSAFLSQDAGILSDPDATIISDGEFNFEVGREGSVFPRMAAVFREKCNWRKLDESHFCGNMGNFTSAAGIPGVQLEDQFVKEAEMGHMEKGLRKEDVYWMRLALELVPLCCSSRMLPRPIDGSSIWRQTGVCW